MEAVGIADIPHAVPNTSAHGDSDTETVDLYDRHHIASWGSICCLRAPFIASSATSLPSPITASSPLPASSSVTLHM
jgi:hypothetical protein